MSQPYEALEIYKFLGSHGYKADFGLRFVWVASMSALDHYISELIVERAVEQYDAGRSLPAKLLNESITFSSAMSLHSAAPASAIFEFKRILTDKVRYRTFQKAGDVADGLAFIWAEQHKWKKISAALGVSEGLAKKTLNSVAIRRDGIVHNADYNPASGGLTSCRVEDASRVTAYISDLAAAIDDLAR